MREPRRAQKAKGKVLVQRGKLGLRAASMRLLHGAAGGGTRNVNSGSRLRPVIFSNAVS